MKLTTAQLAMLKAFVVRCTAPATVDVRATMDVSRI